ncbi:MAG: hypothetical protein JNK60_02320, partial [Acidobacteria bacterium]|nr:hypothetical protein [Acidobacteriota bacterium]
MRLRVAALVLALGLSRGARALDPERPLAQYGQDVWQTEQGLPQDRVNALHTSRDGYLWLGTMSGLARFDGVRFVRFDRISLPGLTDNRIRAIAETGTGTLWVAAEKGVTRIEGGVATPFGRAQGLSDDVVWALLPEPDGAVWVGTESGLDRIAKDGTVKSLGTRDGLSSVRILALGRGRDGSLLVGTNGGGLNVLRNGAVTVYGVRDGLPSEQISAVLEDRGGTLWAGTYDGRFARWDGTRFVPVPLPLSGFRIAALLEDRDGSLWVGGPGLTRISGNRVETLTEAQGLSSNQVLALAEDAEGSLFVGTHGGGLNRLRDGKFSGVSKKDGLAHPFVKSISGTADRVYVGTYGGGLDELSAATGQVLSNLSTKQGLAADLVRTILPAKDGSLWIGTTNGLSRRLADGKLVTYGAADGLLSPSINALLEDRAGRVWATTGGGLHRFENGRFVSLTGRDGLPSDQLGPVFEDRQGAIWVGSYGAGLARIAGGAITVFAEKEGLRGLTVLSIHEDEADEALWFGTSDGGLHRLKDGKVAAVTSREGLHDDGVFQILEAGGSFWLSSNGGVFRIARDDLEAVLSGKRPRLTKTSVFGAADGMPSRQCSGGSVPNAWKGPDGRLWFATTKGVAVIDPARIPQNTTPPPVVIEEAIAAGRVFPRGVPVDVPPGDGRLEIRYAALSFLGTDRVLFRYRLEGFEEATTEAGTRRTAYYTNVPPGRYTFRVSACNSDGVWNETGATLGVVLAPRLYQRRGFLVALVALAVAGAFLVHRMRVSQLVARGRELDAKVVEKTQGLVVEKERAEAARRESDALRAEAEARREELARKNRELHRANLSLERANQKLRELSYLDEPTGLANLRHFEESLEEEWRRGLRSGTALGLLVLSLPGLPALV